jgi:hypothetical protein
MTLLWHKLCIVEQLSSCDVIVITYNHGSLTYILLLNNSKIQHPKMVYSFMNNYSLQQDTAIIQQLLLLPSVGH